jgi:hypothetical protein
MDGSHVAEQRDDVVDRLSRPMRALEPGEGLLLTRRARTRSARDEGLEQLWG